MSGPAQEGIFHEKTISLGSNRGTVYLGDRLRFAQENIGTVRQPLVGGSVIDESQQEEFGLLGYSAGSEVCSALLLRNDWAITASHCVDAQDARGNFIPDPARPGQNMLKPIAAMKLTANWKTVQSQNAVRVETFRPYDVAIIKVAAPFKVHGTTKYYDALMFQDGQFPYFGTAVGANLIICGRGINVFASGQGDSAIPSVIDGKYRMGYAKPTRDEDIRFWYPSVNGQMIAGGDSGGPSFAWVLSGYVLVGVHSVAHTTYVPGKPKTGWTWVTSTPEAANAPVQPVINQIFSIIGPMLPPIPSQRRSRRHPASSAPSPRRRPITSRSSYTLSSPTASCSGIERIAATQPGKGQNRLAPAGPTSRT